MPRALDALRQPLEEGTVRLRRAHGETVFPAAAQLVLAANPCPCAKPGGDAACECSSLVRRRYQNRLSGPLMDRVDLRVDLPAVRSGTLLDTVAGESSEEVAQRVLTARAAAVERWRDLGRSNATVPSSILRRAPYRLPRSVLRPLTEQVDRGVLSARGFDRVVRVTCGAPRADRRRGAAHHRVAAGRRTAPDAPSSATASSRPLHGGPSWSRPARGAGRATRCDTRDCWAARRWWCPAG